MSIFGRHKQFTPWKPVPHDLFRFLAQKYPGITEADKLTVFALMTLYGNRFPTASLVAKILGLHIKTAQKTLRHLRELGIIKGDAKIRMGLGEVREVSLEPLWDAFAAFQPENDPNAVSVAELMGEVKPLLVAAPKVEPPPRDPMTDAEYAKKYGPEGATAAEAAIIRRVQDDYNRGIANLNEDILLEEKELAVLAGVEDIAQKALANHGITAPIEELDPHDLTVKVFDENGYELPKVMHHKELPEPTNEPRLLKYDDLSEDSRKKFFQETMRHSIQLYYPLWSNPEYVSKLNDLIVAAYQVPARSHAEIWDAIGRHLTAWVKAKADEDKHDWRKENDRFGAAYGRYCDDCAEKADDPIPLHDFRELFYRFGKFQEYAR